MTGLAMSAGSKHIDKRGASVKSFKSLIAVATLSLVGVGYSSQANAGCPTGVTLNPLTNPNYLQFGDGLSYSLPILGLSVQSSPGQINDCLVITSGSGGAVAQNSLPGLADNAYDNLQGAQNPFFQTGSGANNTDPGGAAQFNGDSATTWDVRVNALATFLNGGVPIFYFNHNQVNSCGGICQDLFAWAQIILRNDAGTPLAVYNFEQTGFFGPNTGTPSGDPTTFADANGLPEGPGTVALSRYARAAGQVCLGGTGLPGSPIVPCDGSGGPVAATFNENLGANEVANAIIFPELNAFLAQASFGGATVMQIDLRFGCDAATQGTCPEGSVINNGFEQLFIVSSVTPNPPPEIPEPGTLAALGLGLALMAGVTRRRRAK